MCQILNYSPTEIIFPFTPVNTPSSFKCYHFQYRREGIIDLTEDNFTLLGDYDDFEIDYSNLDVHLETDQSVDIPVRFYPHSSLEEKNAILRINCSSNSKYDVILKGTS